MSKFLLRCNYVDKQLAGVYGNILKYFGELETMYCHNQVQNIILHNNKDILVGDRPFVIRKWSRDKLSR